MYEDEVNPRGDATQGFRLFFGTVLLLFGIGVAAWIVVGLTGLLKADSTPALVSAIIPDSDDPLSIGFPEGKFTLPRAAFKPIGYLVVCFVYAIGTGVSVLLINGGTSLLQPDISKLLRRFTELLERKKS